MDATDRGEEVFRRLEAEQAAMHREMQQEASDLARPTTLRALEAAAMPIQDGNVD